MKVYIGADHAGFQLKEQLRPHIETLGYEVEDIGATTLDPADDYPDIVRTLMEKQQNHPDEEQFASIMICGSGIGMCMAANKLPGIRAVLSQNPETAFFSRLHNDANVLCLAGLRSNTESIENVTEGNYQNLIDAGMRTANVSEAKRIVQIFLETPTEAKEGTRHKRRLDKIESLVTS